MAEYCDTPQSKEGSYREYKVCLNGRSILRLLDSSKRLEAFADGVRDYLYLASLEQLARAALEAKDDQTQAVGMAALQTLLEQFSQVYYGNPNDRQAYTQAKHCLAESILNLQKIGLSIETTNEGVLKRHRRRQTFGWTILGSDPNALRGF